MDRATHKRYIEYRHSHTYFGGTGRPQPLLGPDEFEKADRELAELEAKGEDGRDDEEEARFSELLRLLFRD